MKIATFNINNVNSRLHNLLTWLAKAEPDVVCLQELKAADGQFPAHALEAAGYNAIWRGQSTWNGVAILSRAGVPVQTRADLPGDENDHQARYIEAAISGVLVACLYAPNGNPQPGPKYDYKLAWHERLSGHARQLFATKAPVVLAGDFNIVPEARDIYDTRSYDDNALVQPQSRAAFDDLLAQGWTDAVRKAFPSQQVFTFWDYQRNRWPRNAGLRLDHILLNKLAAKTLRTVGIDRDERGQDGASDHVPVWVELG